MISCVSSHKSRFQPQVHNYNNLSKSYQIGFSLNCTAQGYFVKWNTKNFTHEHILKQSTDKCSFPVINLYKPIYVRG